MNNNKKNKSNRAWINQHLTDHYVHLAKQDGYRSRAVYKLLEMINTVNILDNVSTVVDLGSAPGGWSQLIAKTFKQKQLLGKIIGVDILSMEAIEGVEFIHGDFTEEDILQKIITSLDHKRCDLILSDMSPNLSGIKDVDQIRSAYLIELVFAFAKNYLNHNGSVLVKIFHGSEFDQLIKLAKLIFKTVTIKKPEASRSNSKEAYLLCQNLIHANGILCNQKE